VKIRYTLRINTLHSQDLLTSLKVHPPMIRGIRPINPIKVQKPKRNREISAGAERRKKAKRPRIGKME